MCEVKYLWHPGDLKHNDTIKYLEDLLLLFKIPLEIAYCCWFHSYFHPVPEGLCLFCPAVSPSFQKPNILVVSSLKGF